MQIILSLLVSAVSVFIASYLLPGVEVDSFVTALIVAVVMGLINAFIKPIITLFTLPITMVTLGLFIFVINALLVLLVDYLIEGFTVDNFWWALIFGLVLGVINSILGSLTKK